LNNIILRVRRRLQSEIVKMSNKFFLPLEEKVLIRLTSLLFQIIAGRVLFIEIMDLDIILQQ